MLRPVLRGRDIGRFRANWAGLWLIDTHNGYGKTQPVNVDDYTAVKVYLDQFYPKLDKRQDQGVTPYNLRNCAYHGEFKKEKLLWIDLSEQGRFAYDAGEMFCVNSAYMMTGHSIKYLSTVLNSTLVTWFMRNSALNSGMGTTRWVRFTVERIPIPIVQDKSQQPFIQLMDRISQVTDMEEIKKEKLEAEIDGLVNSLYGLTEAEVQAVTRK
ncbi:MAG: hypothetical protein OXI63_19360 [Candidatus Poribacteria bacterium]|nr:hypothetical protein [Candidatus Poribacteria bacterium]